MLVHSSAFFIDKACSIFNWLRMFKSISWKEWIILIAFAFINVLRKKKFLIYHLYYKEYLMYHLYVIYLLHYIMWERYYMQLIHEICNINPNFHLFWYLNFLLTVEEFIFISLFNLKTKLDQSKILKNFAWISRTSLKNYCNKQALKFVP